MTSRVFSVARVPVAKKTVPSCPLRYDWHASTSCCRVSGVDSFSAAYEDYRDADVLMIIGTDPYETKTVAFTEWMRFGLP